MAKKKSIPEDISSDQSTPDTDPVYQDESGGELIKTVEKEILRLDALLEPVTSRRLTGKNRRKNLAKIRTGGSILMGELLDLVTTKGLLTPAYTTPRQVGAAWARLQALNLLRDRVNGLQLRVSDARATLEADLWKTTMHIYKIASMGGPTGSEIRVLAAKMKEKLKHGSRTRKFDVVMLGKEGNPIPKSGEEPGNPAPAPTATATPRKKKRSK